MKRAILLAILTVGVGLLMISAQIEAKKKRKAPKDLPTLMTERGKLLLQEEFSGQALPEQWKIAIGKWEIEEEALKGTEQQADNHAAVIRLDTECTDAVFQFSFMFQGGKSTGLSLNNKDGHVCRLGLSPIGFNIFKDRPTRESTEEGQQLDSAKFEFKDGQWYDIVVEIIGKEMIACVGNDSKFVVFGEHDGVAKPKTNFGFYVAGESIYFDDVRVWEAQPNKKWDKTKKKLEAMREFMKKKGLR